MWIETLAKLCPGNFRRALWPVVLLAWVWGCSSGGVDRADCENDGNCSGVLKVARVSGALPLDPGAPFWNAAGAPEKRGIELGPQLITNPQWPNPSIKKVVVSAARNASQISVRVEWEDEAPNAEFSYGVKYTDQAAVMFPLHPGPDFPPIFMGDEDHIVNIWQWKAALQKDLQKAAREKAGGPVSPVQDLNAGGFSTLTNQDHQDVTGRGVWANNKWRVVFQRNLTDADENDIQFTGSLPMAIAVWNGGNRETNGQKGISSWILLEFN